MERRFDLHAPVDALLSSSESRRFAAALGFGRREQWEVGIVVQELATNALAYGDGGAVVLRATGEEADGERRRGIEIRVEDRGPGIPDLDSAVQDGFSQGRSVSGDDFDPRRDSLGIGLGAVLRLMDTVAFENKPGGGLLVTAYKFLGRRAVEHVGGRRAGDAGVRPTDGSDQPAS